MTFLAMSDNHGWGKGPTEAEAIKLAVSHSMNRKTAVVAVWSCNDDAFVDELGTAYGVTSERRRFERKSSTTGKWKEVNDTGKSS